MKNFAALGAVTALLATACAPSPVAPKVPAPISTTAAPSSDHTHVDTSLGFSLAIPKGMTWTGDFQRSYLDAGSWKSFATPDSRGIAAAALVLDGSDKITAAELRVGVSRDAAAVAACIEIPDSGVASHTDAVTLDGTSFVHFHAGDAAMSHYLQVEGYRAVHDGRCYAIDLWISGTRPDVYDPPATVPFERDDALRRLHAALAGFRFVN